MFIEKYMCEMQHVLIDNILSFYDLKYVLIFIIE